MASPHIEISTTNNCGFAKLVLEQAYEGVYVFVYKTGTSQYPELDHLQDNLKQAKQQCDDEYGVPINTWKIDSQIIPIMGKTTK